MRGKIEKTLEILDFKVYSNIYDVLEEIKNNERLSEELDESLYHLEQAEGMISEAIEEIKKFLEKAKDVC